MLTIKINIIQLEVCICAHDMFDHNYFSYFPSLVPPVNYRVRDFNQFPFTLMPRPLDSTKKEN